MAGVNVAGGSALSPAAFAVAATTTAGRNSVVTSVIAAGILPWVTSFSGATLALQFAAAVASGKSFFVPAGLGAIALSSISTGILATGQCIYGAGSSSGTWISATLGLTYLIRAGSGSRVFDLEFRGAFTFGAVGPSSLVKNGDGGVHCIQVRNVTDVQVVRCTFSGFGTSGVYIMADYDSSEVTKDVIVDSCRFTALLIDTATYGTGQIPIFSETQYSGYLTDLTIGGYARNIAVFNVQLRNNTINYGTQGIQVGGTRGLEIIGGKHFYASHRGVSIQSTEDFLVQGVLCDTTGEAGVHVANGARRGVVKGNVVRGTLGGDNSALQAYYGVDDVLFEGNDCDSRFDLWVGPELRKPGFGLRIGQRCKRVDAINNKFRGYWRGIAVHTTISYASILNTDVNYQHSGVEGCRIKNNDVLWDYTNATATSVKSQFLQNSGTGIWVYKSGAWEDSTLDNLGLKDITLESNTVDGYQVPYSWDYVTDTSGNPAAKTRLRDYQNISKNSPASNIATYANGIASTDIVAIGTQWDWKTWSGDLTMTSGSYTYTTHAHRFKHISPTEVECFSVFVLSANTSGSGALKWPLPYTSISSGAAGWVVSADRIGGIVFSSLYSMISNRMVAGNAFAEIGQTGTATTTPWAALGADKLAATASIALAVRYELPAP